MRPRHRAIGFPGLILSGLSAVLLAGCSSGASQDTLATSSLRPNEGMRRDAPRRYPDGSTAGGTYERPYAEAPRRYVDPGEPTPREMAAYDSGHDRYGPPPRNIQTASIGSNGRTYDPNARWQQPASASRPAPPVRRRPAITDDRPRRRTVR